MPNRVAVVTGAIGALGTAMCKQLTDQDRTVIATHRPGDEPRKKAEQWQKTMAEAGYTVKIMPVDVADYDSCKAFMESVEKEFGPVDVLVNNAGITNDAPLKRMGADQWTQVINVNLNSMFNMCRHAFEGMCNRGFGRIVNISSINGGKGQFGQSNYAAAKAGVYGFTKSIALEGARKGVTVNSISPGYIDSPMVRAVPEKVLESIVAAIPVGRLGQPDDIARAVAFLTAEDAGFVTGADLVVNGGQFMG